MKRFFTTKFFIAVIFFCVGFLTNHLLVKYKTTPQFVGSQEERFPVNPQDFDHKSMLETIDRMNSDDEMMGSNPFMDLSHREDDKFFYYDIPVKDPSGANHKLNVEIKDGMIKISEDTKSNGNGAFETSSERMFSIEPGLDADRAEVINEKDKIVIKIPKK